MWSSFLHIFYSTKSGETCKTWKTSWNNFTAVINRNIHVITSYPCTNKIPLQQTEAINLNVSLERKKIYMLPITAIKSYQLPITRNSGTATQTCHVQIRKDPTNSKRQTLVYGYYYMTSQVVLTRLITNQPSVVQLPFINLHLLQCITVIQM